MDECARCGKPTRIPRDDFTRWWFSGPNQGPFVTLAEFLEPFCQCKPEEAVDG